MVSVKSNGLNLNITILCKYKNVDRISILNRVETIREREAVRVSLLPISK